MLESEQQIQLVAKRRQELELRWDAIRNNDLLNLLILMLPNHLQADRCALFVLDPDSEELWLEAGTSLDQRQICVGLKNSMVGQCVTTGSCINRSNLENIEGDHQRIGQSLSYTVSTALTIPIFSSEHDVGTLTGGVIGALQVLNRKDGQPFNELDQTRLESVAREIQPSVQKMYTSRSLVQQTVKLDKSLEILQQRVNTLRPGKSMRIFEPASHALPEGFLHHRWNGRCYPPFVDKRATDHLTQTWNTQANDVFISTHFRAGSYLIKKFLVEIVRSTITLASGNPLSTGDIGQQAIPWPEVKLSQESPANWQQFIASTTNSPRFWYLHCGIEDLPFRQIHSNTKFVVSIRDPRAVVVSQYFFFLHHPLLEIDPNLTLERFTQIFVENDIYFGNYFEHVRNWLKPSNQLNSSQVCIVRYEDLVVHKLASLKKLHDFTLPNTEIDSTKLQSIVDSTDFEAMKRSISSNPGSFPFNPKMYFRSGTIDNWRKHLSPASESLIIDAAHRHWGDLGKDSLVSSYFNDVSF